MFSTVELLRCIGITSRLSVCLVLSKIEERIWRDHKIIDIQICIVKACCIYHVISITTYILNQQLIVKEFVYNLLHWGYRLISEGKILASWHCWADPGDIVVPSE